MLDTHVWVWWVSGNAKFTKRFRAYLDANRSAGLGISVFSCWEVAKLVENDKLDLALPVGEWIEQALAHPGVQLLEFTPRIAVESTQLPRPFHRDPADQIIVATARVLDVPLLTADEKILAYPHVRTLK